MLHTLLLNGTFECISFLVPRKIFKLLAKEKIEVLEHWDEEVSFGNGNIIYYPAVVRLKHHVRWIPKKMRFNRTGVFRRDQFSCQYCSKTVATTKLTIDHILPRARGGESNWANCCAACFTCNNKKGNKTPEEAGMALIKKPIVPQLTIANEYHAMKLKHDSWKDYIPMR